MQSKKEFNSYFLPEVKFFAKTANPMNGGSIFHEFQFPIERDEFIEQARPERKAEIATNKEYAEHLKSIVSTASANSYQKNNHMLHEACVAYSSDEVLTSDAIKDLEAKGFLSVQILPMDDGKVALWVNDYLVDEANNFHEASKRLAELTAGNQTSPISANPTLEDKTGIDRDELIEQLTQAINKRENTTLTPEQVSNYIGSDMTDVKLAVWLEGTLDDSDPVTASDVLDIWDEFDMSDTDEQNFTDKSTASLKENNISNVKHAKKWVDGDTIKFRYPETNLVFEFTDGLIYMTDVDDTENDNDLLRQYRDLKWILENYGIPLEQFQEDFKDCEIDSSCSTYIYSVNTLQEV